MNNKQQWTDKSEIGGKGGREGRKLLEKKSDMKAYQLVCVEESIEKRIGYESNMKKFLCRHYEWNDPQ